MLESHQQQHDEVSVKEMFAQMRESWRFLQRKWFVILAAAILGGSIGLLYSILKPVNYESRVSFVVEDSKMGVGNLASLAGQFGLDVGGSSSGGLFSTDNILLFLKSESLCRETLLTPYDSSGTQLLADKYADAAKLKLKWAQDKKIGQINFSKYSNGNLPRLEDSLMQLITKRILKKDLEVDKPDKKASFVEVTASMPDEWLSKCFSERLVSIATDRYISSKTKLKALNVAKLQQRADSLSAVLANRTYSAAASQQSLVDINPALRIVPVAAEISARDKMMTATVYGEVVKNLEIAKVALSQETPTIQIVDQSSLPLKKDIVRKSIAIVIGGFLMGLFSIAALLFVRKLRMQ